MNTYLPDLTVSYGVNGDIPFINIGNNNILWFMQNGQMLSTIHILRNMVGAFMIVFTVIYVYRNIASILDGEFK